MELYMMNRQHGRMILESVENGPLIWPTIEENGVTRPRKYSELTPADAIQADCDVKATNIILQGLPPEERECKLYDEFDKFAYKKGETLRDFYLRFSLLLNDMNIYNVKLEQFQVNTKFLNTLPPEWSKFMTDVKLVRDLHTTNIDQLHAYLGQHEFHANEVRLMHERNSDPLALVATHQMTQSPYQTHQNSYQNSQFQPQVSLYQSPQYGSPYQSQQYSTNQPSTPLSITYPSNDYQSSVHHNVYSPQPSIPQLEYAPTVNQQPQQPEFPQLDSGLTVPVFKQGDDPIDAINHMMSFLSAVVTSRYLTTNNQLRNLSNPRQQAIINDERVTLQPVQGRKISFATGTTRTYSLGASRSNSRKQRTVICYNCKGEGHMSKQCTKPKRKQDDSWFKDKVLLVQAQANGTLPKLLSWQIYLIMVQMLSLSVNDTLTAELERYKEQVKVLKEEQNVDLKSKDNISDSCEQSVEIDRLKQTLSDYLKEKESLTQTVTLLKNDFKKEESRNIDREIDLEKKIKQLDNINSMNSSDHSPFCRSTKVEVPKELPKVNMVNMSLKKLKHHLAGFDVVVKERTMTTAITEGSWGFKHTKAYFRDEIIPYVKALKDIFNTFDQYLIDELTEV
ncbi:retrovirus-related pol polyprotein from transposon TNT 1-94 [Tanacetum coccineum]